MALTKDFAGRAFLIFVLYIVLLFTLGFVIGMPLPIALIATRNNPEMQRLVLALANVLNTLSTTLVMPVFTDCGLFVYLFLLDLAFGRKRPFAVC